MNQKERLVADIVAAEWNMMQAVPGIGGRASCQDDFNTFRIMRVSQSASWSEAALESYLCDLKDAERLQRNLLTEKYARMMETTSPSEYAAIAHLLPRVDPRAPELIERIAAIILAWATDLQEKYPHVLRKGRPIFSSADAAGVTSIETYLRGELATYSVKTLELYLANIMQQQAEGINGSAITLQHTMKDYGFASLEEANEKLKPRA
jgi:hypothetical protein